MPSLFSSVHQREIAHLLGDRLLAIAASMPHFAPVVEGVNRLRHLIWQDFAAPGKPAGSSRQELQKEATALTDSLSRPEDRQAALTLWLRLGQLYEMAGLVGRANTVDLWRDPVKPRLPGGITDMVTTAIEEGISPLQALARPVFEVVMTAHPTNVNDKETILALRETGKTLDTLRVKGGETKKNLEALHVALTRLLQAPAIPQRLNSLGERVPTNLSVYEETDLILYYLGNIYEDMPLVYGGFDRVLARKAEQAYDPATLTLNMRFSSWGSSGDKDGNSQVTAGTTLEAVVMHHHEIIRRYRDSLAALPSLGQMEKLALWHTRLDTIERRLQDLRTQIRQALAPIAEINAETLRLEAMIGDGGQAEQLATLRTAMRTKRLAHFSPEKFRGFSAALQDILWELGEYPKQHFLAEIHSAYQVAKGETRTELLLLMRRVRAFGFQFARIEFRETAQEYSRVVQEIFSAYARLNPADPLTANLLQTPYLKLAEHKKMSLLSRLIDGGMAATIVKAVRKDIEQRGAGLMYDAEDAAPITLHTLLRMELARDFPDMITANVLAECEEVSHLLEAQFLQAGCTDAQGTRPIMGIVPLYEEPDIMKEVGGILSRAYTTPTYRRHMALVAEHLFARGYGDGRPTQQVQIAHSDNTRRAGLAAARALIYQAHDLIREAGRNAGIVTQFFEGGSNSDPFRGGIRSISATANMYDTHDFIKFTFQGGDLLNYFNYPGSTERLFARNLSHMAKTLVLKTRGTWAKEGTDENDHPRNLRAWTEAALPPLIATAEEYRQHIFHKDAIGRFLYETRDAFGNTGSRAGARASGREKAQRETRERMIDPADMRTITFSESFAHAGITPTWLGTQTLEAALLPVIAEFEGATFYDLYKKSAVFRDVADRIAFGIAMSDLPGLLRYYPALEGDPFVMQLKHEYFSAARLVERALSPAAAQPDAATDVDALREEIRRLLPHMHGILHHKGDFMTVAQEMKRAWREDRGKNAATPSIHHRWVMSLAHAAIDCVTHGRILTADDPMYRKMAFDKAC